MLPHEADEISTTIAGWYPGRYGDQELADLVQRLRRFEYRHVIEALNQWRETTDYKPAPAGIIKLIKQIEARVDDATADLVRDVTETYAQILRARDSRLAGTNDAYVLFTQARGCWRRDRQLNGRKLSDRARIDERWQDQLRRDLLAAGYTADHAERLSAWVSRDDTSEVVEYLKNHEPEREVAA